MTAQRGELLVYEGKKYFMHSEPFNQYLAENMPDIDLKPINTSLWRGYLGEWQIENGKLYLTSISGHGVIRNDVKYKAGRIELRKKLRQGLLTPKENGHLLRKFEQECLEEVNLSLKSIFNTEQKVLASWVSGYIHVPFGELLQYIHCGHESVYEYKMVFFIQEGVVKGVETIKNEIDD